MITVNKSYPSLREYLMSSRSRVPNRNEVMSLMSYIEWELVHDEKGDYDTGLDGYLVYKSPEDILYRIDFEDDSYSTGTFLSAYKVQKKTVTKDVYE